jgi:hypothetical protein
MHPHSQKVKLDAGRVALSEEQDPAAANNSQIANRLVLWIAAVRGTGGQHGVRWLDEEVIGPLSSSQVCVRPRTLLMLREGSEFVHHRRPETPKRARKGIFAHANR